MDSQVEQIDRDAGYAEAKEMLQALLSPDLISGTAIRVARDYMMQFARRQRLASLALPKVESETIERWQNFSCSKLFDHKWLDPECIEGGCRSLAGRSLMERLYEVVRHDADCGAIGGAGDKDCTCDAVPVLRELEAAWRLPIGEMPTIAIRTLNTGGTHE